MSKDGTDTPNRRPLVYDRDLHIKISTAQYDQLTAIAASMGKNLAETVRLLIEDKRGGEMERLREELATLTQEYTDMRDQYA